MNDITDLGSFSVDRDINKSKAIEVASGGKEVLFNGFGGDDGSSHDIVDQPQQLADAVFEAICKDIEEKPTTKGSQIFRDKVFENCSPQQIVLKNVRMGPNGATALTRMMLSMEVSKLDLSHNILGDEGVHALVRSLLTKPVLKHLNLSSNNIGLDGMMEIISLLPTLKTLDLGNIPGVHIRNQINGKACTELCKALCANPELWSLGLKNNAIGEDSLKYIEFLAVVLSKFNTHLCNLNLDMNMLGTRGANMILSALAHNKSLRYLSLSSNDISADIAKTLDVVLRINKSLCGLTLKNNPLGLGVPRFCEALATNNSLVVLDLENCGISDMGAFALANALVVNRSITMINLANNHITGKGAYPLAAALKINDVISHINLSNNQIKGEPVMELAEVMKTNKSLVSINLSSCKIDDTAVSHLLTAIASNPHTSIKTLKLRNNFISGLTGDVIIDAMYRNTTITTLDLQDTQVDHIRANQCKALCHRNQQMLKEAIPAKLRREIESLRGEQIRLRRAEAMLYTYHQCIENTEARIAETEKERVAFMASQQKCREEIRAQIQNEQDMIAEANNKLTEKRQELTNVERAYSDRLSDMQLLLDKEIENKKAIERDLANVRKTLEDTIRQCPSKIEHLKKQIDIVKTEKTLFQKQLTNVRKELGKLKTAYEEGKPVSDLIEQARALLLHNAVIEEEAARRSAAEKQHASNANPEH